MPPNHPAVEGRAAILNWLKAFPTVTRFDMSISEIEGRGDLAYVRGHVSMTLQPEGAEAPVEDRVKYIEIRKEQVDGSWPIAVDIFNSDLA